MTGRVEGKVVLVTGAGGAQGAATSLLLAREGALVVATDNSESDVQATSRVLTEGGYEHAAHVLDVSNGDAWTNVVHGVEERFGRLDGLAHFAAVLCRDGVTDTAVDDWTRTINVNLTGTWLGLRSVIPALRRSGGGSIVNIGSIDAVVGRAGATAYQASKGGVRMLSKSAATEVAAEQIRINCVHPGPMERRMRAVAGATASASDAEGEALLETLRADIPMGRLGRVDDVAAAVLYLLSDDARFVTGADFMVDGGLTAA